MLTTQDDKVSEGTLDENVAPPTPLRTSVMPILQMTPDQLPSLTGTTETVMMSEDADKTEHQDASLTTQETQPITDSPTPDTQPTEESAVVVLPKQPDKTLVLVVEDTVELCEVIVATLENMDLQTDSANHGKQGLAKMRELNPQVLMMDIGLPDITGWKMLDEIKEHYESSNLPLPIIIVITAYGDPANRLIGKLQNVYTYLLKPFTPDEVEKVVTNAIKGDEPPAFEDINKV